MPFSFTKKTKKAKLIKAFSIITLILTFLFIYLGDKYGESWIYTGVLCWGLSMLFTAFVYDKETHEGMMALSLLPMGISRIILVVLGVCFTILSLALFIFGSETVKLFLEKI